VFSFVCLLHCFPVRTDILDCLLNSAPDCFQCWRYPSSSVDLSLLVLLAGTRFRVLVVLFCFVDHILQPRACPQRWRYPSTSVDSIVPFCFPLRTDIPGVSSILRAIAPSAGGTLHLTSVVFIFCVFAFVVRSEGIFLLSSALCLRLLPALSVSLDFCFVGVHEALPHDPRLDRLPKWLRVPPLP